MQWQWKISGSPTPRTQTRVLRFAVVRGISEFATGKAAAEKGNSQELAAIHAAAFAVEMLVGLIGGQLKRTPSELETKLL